jgi:post-segregation antitoxin (ccd killing protein)
VAKKKLTLSVDGGLVAKAKELGINISEVAEVALKIHISEVAEVALKIRAAEFKGTYAAYRELFNQMLPFLAGYGAQVQIGGTALSRSHGHGSNVNSQPSGEIDGEVAYYLTPRGTFTEETRHVDGNTPATSREFTNITEIPVGRLHTADSIMRELARVIDEAETTIKALQKAKTVVRAMVDQTRRSIENKQPININTATTETSTKLEGLAILSGFLKLIMQR